MLTLGLLMLISVVLCLVPVTSGSPILLFFAKVGGLFAFLWFLLLLVKFLITGNVMTLGG